MNVTAKVGSYIDVGLKYVGSITFGTYQELGTSYSFSEGMKDVRAKKFAIGYSNEGGFMYTYDFKTEQHTFGIAIFGVGYEYGSSSLQSVNNSHFLGFLTGISAGVGVGGEVSVKHGYKF